MTDVNELNTDDVTEVELIVVDNTTSHAGEEQEIFATAQDLEELISVGNIDEASKLLNVKSDVNIPTMLTSFEESIHNSIEDKKTRMLKPLTEAKNILLRSKIEHMIKDTGRFDLTGMIPFKEACISCKGTGEIYKFFRIGETEPCKFCTDGEPEDNGYVFITCRVCKGTKIHEGKECARCHRDPKTDLPIGKERVKCRQCRGKAIWRKLVIDSKIKSTTHCRHCKGRGFTLPEPPVKKVKTVTPQTDRRKKIGSLGNPVISAQLGEQLKRANIKE